jgi:glyoxylase-like metal-dependent hydrolase (beta-lactamase superfamily II)
MLKHCRLQLLLLLILPFSFAHAQLSSAPLIEENATIRLGEYTYAISDNNVGGVPNVGIVVGDNATLIIDPGMGRENGEIVLREAQRLSNNRQFYIVSTHYHPEHTMGYLAFPDSAIYINSNTQENEFAEDGTRMIELFSSRSPTIERLLADAERRVADITFDETYTLDLGNVTVQMVLVGPTHTRGDTGFFIEEDQVLFAGDVVMNNSFLAATPNSSISTWLTAFDTFEAMQPRTIVPAHGEIGDNSLIPIQRVIVSGILNHTLALKAKGESMDAAIESVSSTLQDSHPDWSRANGIAALARSAWLEDE